MGLSILGAATWLTAPAHAQAPGLKPGPEATPAAAASPVPRPSTAALLGQAVKDGKLDAETALVYEVFAAFGDPRLPATYRGSDAGGVEMGRVVTGLAGRYPELSPAAKAAAGPFLMPPYHVGSWWDLRRRAPIPGSAAASSQQGASATSPAPPPGAPTAPPDTREAPPCVYGAPSPDLRCPVSPDWDYLDADVPVRIWWQRRYPEDRVKAEWIRYELEHRIWSALVHLMGRAPLDDWGEPHNGGDGRVDIALLDEAPGAAALGYRGCDAPTPGFMLVQRTAITVSAVPIPVRAAVAHEFMHLLQYAFDVAGSCDGEYRWLAEATATWAEDYIYPTGNTEHREAATYVNDTWRPLDHSGGRSGPGRTYGAYVFFFYLARQHGPEVIRTIWEHTERHGSLEAIDRALPEGLERVWPRFAAYTWNQDRVDHYRRWDQLEAAPGTQGYWLSDDTEVVLDGDGDRSLTGYPTGQHAAINYQRFQFTDPAVRTIAFHNGWTFKLTKKDYPNPGTLFETEPLTSDQRRGFAVQALLKIDGQWDAEPRDWTDTPVATFCRDVKAERVEEMILIWSNARLADAAPGGWSPPGEWPTLWVSNMGCWRWKGTVAHVHGASTIHAHWTGEVTFERVGAPGPLIKYRQVAGQVHWNYDKTDGDCRYEGNGTAGVLRDFDLGWSYNYVISGPQYRKVALVATLEGGGTYVRLCPDRPPRPGSSAFSGVQTTGGGDQGEVSPDGTVVEGHYVHPTGHVDTWRLEAQRE